MSTPKARGTRRFQPLTRPTQRDERPWQADWADAMKEVLDRRKMGVDELFALVAEPLDLDNTHKLRRWLNNKSTVDARAIKVLARAVGTHPMEMLAAYGIVDDSLCKLAKRAETAERRFHQAQERLALTDRATGGALFAEAALADGKWSATVVPHFRGRRCRYRYADYVLLDRLDGISTRDHARQVFAEAFERSGAAWDDMPVAPVGAAPWPEGRVYVPRFSAPHPARPYAVDVPGSGCRLDGVIVTGLHWCGSYAVAPLLAAALGWGMNSFALQARGVHGGGRLDESLADELLRDWLDDPASQRNQVWAHVLTEPPGPETVAARLLGTVPPNVAVVLLRPDETAAALLADLSGGNDGTGGNGGTTMTAEQVLARSAAWADLLPPKPGIVHVPVHAQFFGGAETPPQHIPAAQRFLDDYFECSVDATLAALELLASPGKAADLVSASAAESDPFAALAAGSGGGATGL